MEDLTFHLEGVVKERNELQDFQGPLSLILMLLSKNKIEIRDIKIADILDQYLDYLAEMERMDLEIASEFVQMASHLLYIKTRTLLAGDEEVSELEELMSSLEQLKCRDIYTAVQKVTPELKKASETGLLYYAKMPEPLPKTTREYEYRHEPADLFKALYTVITRGGKPVEPEFAHRIAPSRIVYEVRTKSRELISLLQSCDARLDALYARCESRSEIVATFISILELCSMGSIVLEGEDGDYTLKFVGGNIEEILERIVE
ncbi:MAG: segregation/condensation protein A [Bacillota bacterium]|nr:segregation/condensation protein A [Bacillota bacterium]